eukprot:GFUD01126891.1.p1 GENE.GFUD01126891.1~~GFUD01126891.1.p1  ORF type:complete len:365 (-),score=74.13 GFUD01126891.1:348-1373(-)
MENWGLVLYRETCILVDPLNSSQSSKQWVAIVVCHETAHQWFGNLVTMEWWTHLWLNEGFASFMENLTTDVLYPEYKIWDQFVPNTLIEALMLDSLDSSHPIEVDVGHPSEVDEIFDNISYNKGASVIRMLYDWISMSKSVSRGLTTAGCMVANHTTYAKDLIGALQETGKLVDTIAKPDQMNFLIGAHKGVEKRCENAYSNAAMIGKVLQQAVKKYCSYDMALAFVAPEHAAVGYTTSTFSFNLPSPLGASEEVCEALAQRFVDLICAHPEFKPCVSFGQDNGLVYATVPATSTQGAIKAEDKAKQAVGGVQLTRLSFPPTCDTKAIGIIMTEAIAKIYS